ncbi:MAG: hypothetical protein WCT27_05125 [Patescibacteria group bacterium]
MQSNKSKVDVYHGLDGIKTVFNDIVATKKELVGWGATDRARELLPEFTDDYIRQREQHNVHARQLAVEGRGVLQTEWSKFKYIPKEYSSPATTLIYGNTVALMMWFSEPVVSIRIRDAKIAESYRHHFEFLWGTKLFSAEEILASQVVKQEISHIFGNQPISIIDRKSSRIIRLKNESAADITRIILLPPGGSTAGEYSGELADHDKFSPHPEALSAKITVLGGVAPGRSGFRKIDRAIKFAYYTKRDVELGRKEFFKEQYKSSHTPPFSVVKPDGFGFWHNISNTSNEWVLLVLEKQLAALIPLGTGKIIKSLPGDQQAKMLTLVKDIQEKGDKIFVNNDNPLRELGGIKPDALARLFVAMLNVPDHANHEPCTAVALLLKLAKGSRQVVKVECQAALESNGAPAFYLKEIIKKLK